MTMLSGLSWWQENQARYPNSNRIEDLAPAFLPKVKGFVAALRTAGAKVGITSTFRHPTRAHLMHYSWRVSDGFAAWQVPAVEGLDIQWDHGNATDSMRGAAEMVVAFGLVFAPALHSRHTEGLAIDMTITWEGRLDLFFPGVSCVAPRNGAENTVLHTYACEAWGVRKLVTDPPHWSSDGR